VALLAAAASSGALSVAAMGDGRRKTLLGRWVDASPLAFIWLGRVWTRSRAWGPGGTLLLSLDNEASWPGSALVKIMN